MSNHVCTACAPGKVNPAGDAAFGQGTFCGAVLCGANYYVLKHACVICIGGFTNAPGDGASGEDTACLGQPLVPIDPYAEEVARAAHSQQVVLALSAATLAMLCCAFVFGAVMARDPWRCCKARSVVRRRRSGLPRCAVATPWREGWEEGGPGWGYTSRCWMTLNSMAHAKSARESSF